MTAIDPSRKLTAEAVQLVVGRGLIPPADVHRYGIRGRDLSQSNGVVLVESGSGRSFVVKDLRQTVDPRQGAARNELELYRRAGDDPRLRGFLPALLDHDEERGLMILAGLHTSRRLDRLDGGWSMFSAEVAGWLGRALGEWHRLAAELSGFAPVEPWLFRIGDDDRLPVLDRVPELRDLAREVLADPRLVRVVERTRRSWRVETVIHGDVRFSNVMVQASPPAVRFVDWEMSGRGDPAWDVAGAVQDYLALAGGADPFADARVSANIETLLHDYRSASTLPMEWSRLAPFVASRLVLRAFQLVRRSDDWERAVDWHLEAARSLERGVVPAPRPTASSQPATCTAI